MIALLAGLGSVAGSAVPALAAAHSPAGHARVRLAARRTGAGTLFQAGNPGGHV